MTVKDLLEELASVGGFMAAAIFTAEGEVLDSVTSYGMTDIQSVGPYAHEVLLNAQKATGQMGLGRGNVMEIRSQKAVILMRCLNECAEFSATVPGKAHFHALVVMEPGGKIEIAKMILDRVIGKMAPLLR